MSDQKITREQALEAFARHGDSYAKAAAEYGVSRGTVYNHVKRDRESKLITGAAPDGYKVAKVSTTYDANGEKTRQSVQVKLDGRDPAKVTHVPDPKTIIKTSTLFDGDGNVSAQWVLEKPEDIKRENAWREFATTFAAEVPRAEAVMREEGWPAELCAVYPVGDHHVGMLAWAIETRSDSYDLKISEALLSTAARYLMQAAPVCEVALICFMGDFLHFDGFKAVTPQSGHLLDADSRFPKVARTAIRMARHMIEQALLRHQYVQVIWEIGNHDPVSAIFMMELLANVYENEPRVTIDTNPGKFHFFEYGRNLLMTTHGDNAKGDKLGMIMAADMPEAWGRTEHRLVLSGHVHHESRKDFTGFAMESVPVLIPNDAYAANGGYRSHRAMQVIVLDKQDGEVERHTFNAKRFNRSH